MVALYLDRNRGRALDYYISRPWSLRVSPYPQYQLFNEALGEFAEYLWYKG